LDTKKRIFLKDAVTILKDDSRPYQCRGFGSIFLGTDKYSISITELVQHQNEEEEEETEEQQTERDESSECDDRNCGGTSEVDESINNNDDNDDGGGYFENIYLKNNFNLKNKI